jgi:cytoskeleton protein RodZ
MVRNLIHAHHMNELASGQFGASLRLARERRGLTKAQIADSTKLSPSSISKLENGKLAGLPGGIYLRATVRSYAKMVGLDPEEAVRNLVDAYPAAAPEPAETVPQPLATVPPGARRVLQGS